MPPKRQDRQKDIEDAVKWARNVQSHADRYLFIDIDADDWENNESPVTHIAIGTIDGTILLDQELRTTEKGALPSFSEIWPKVKEIKGDKRFITYAENLVWEIMYFNFEAAGLKEDLDAECLMEQYNKYKNVWSSEHEDYKYQKLPGKQDGHPAKDCIKMARLLETMQTMPEKKSASELTAKPATAKDLTVATAGAGFSIISLIVTILMLPIQILGALLGSGKGQKGKRRK